MTCREAHVLMDGVFDGELAEGEAQGLHRHLAQCEPCAQQWRSGWQVRDLLSAEPVPDPGERYYEEATASILMRIEVEDQLSKPAPRSLLYDPLRHGPLAIRGVAATLLFGLGIYFGANYVAPAATDAPVAWDRTSYLTPLFPQTHPDLSIAATDPSASLSDRHARRTHSPSAATACTVCSPLLSPDARPPQRMGPPAPVPAE